MILPRPQDAIHKMYLYRLLMAIIDDPALSRSLYFKGGTCAAMAGWLDRFSLDLDFDLAPKTNHALTRAVLRKTFSSCGLTIKQESKDGLFFILQYKAKEGERNSLKCSVMTQVPAANQYEPLYLSDIKRYAVCQKKDTMVANKLVAPLSRYEQYHTIAGRDIYDIHYFLSHGYVYRKEIIAERRGVTAAVYIRELIAFINRRVTDRTIVEDLNYLLPSARFQITRNTLKEETLMLLRTLLAA